MYKCVCTPGAGSTWCDVRVRVLCAVVRSGGAHVVVPHVGGRGRAGGRAVRRGRPGRRAVPQPRRALRPQGQPLDQGTRRHTTFALYLHCVSMLC